MQRLNEDLLTADQVAQELDTTRRTVDRWHSRRIGPPRIKIGRKVYYRRDAVREWLLRLEQRGEAA
ncbi:MAG: helix-turn-helix domain-containing protein [Xanthomonadales bacterium]|nr:helix-turn-helix domain-containing protein [Xanthomonadales bacterium]